MNQQQETTSRAQWVRDHYRLEETTDGRWRAVSSGSATHPQTGKVYSWHYEHIDDTREVVCRYAWAHWGHFNHQDETAAFAEIFSY